MEKKTRKKSELLTIIIVLIIAISVLIVGYAIYTRIVNEVQYNQSQIETEQENKEQQEKNNNSEILYKLSDNKYINENGYIKDNTNTSNVILLEGITIKDNQERLDENSLNLLSELITLRKTLENNGLLDKIQKIDVADTENIKLYINSENKIVELGNFENLTSKCLYIKNIMEQEKNKKGTISVKEVNKSYFRESL